MTFTKKDNNNEESDGFDDDVKSLSVLNYINSAIKRMQFSLTLPDLDEGLKRYILLVNHILVHVRADGHLNDVEEKINENEYINQHKQFMQKLEDFKNTDEYKEQTNRTMQQYVLANKKLELVLAMFYGNEEITGPMKLK